MNGAGGISILALLPVNSMNLSGFLTFVIHMFPSVNVGDDEFKFCLWFLPLREIYNIYSK